MMLGVVTDLHRNFCGIVQLNDNVSRSITVAYN